MDAAANGVAEEHDDERGIDQQDVLYRMVFFLATVTVRLFSRVLGADNRHIRRDPAATVHRPASRLPSDQPAPLLQRDPKVWEGLLCQNPRRGPDPLPRATPEGA